MEKLEIISELPGIFYRRQAPDQPFFKKEGDLLKKGDVIGLVEVMKSYFEVKSGVAGTLTKFLIEDEAAVMAGQVIAEVTSS